MSSSQSKLYCLIRKQYVAHTPEEEVRQVVLRRLIDLGFPPPLIAVERGISSFATHGGSSPPNRRTDIICYANIDGLKPLLLIECKAVKLSAAVVNQVVGYNTYVNAYFVAIANQDELQLGAFDGTSYQFYPELLSYDRLVASI